MDIIPAIDIIDGKCVRLEKGDYAKKTEYSDDPLVVAKKFESVGIKRLHLVDLDGAKANHVVNLKTVKKIASQTALTIDFGGGVKSDEDIEKVFAAGAKMVTGGSVAVKNPDLFEKWLAKYGSEKVILGADVLNNKIMTSGWQESSTIDLSSFLRYYLQKGIKKVICTDISKDGMLQGPSLVLYREIIKEFPEIQLTASGGVSSLDDVIELNKAGLSGVIIGKAYYEGRITLDQLAELC